MRTLARHGVDATRSHAERKRAIGFAERDLEAHQRGQVLALEGDEMPTGIEHGYGERFQADFRSLGKGGFDDGVGGFEFQVAQGSLPFLCGDSCIGPAAGSVRRVLSK
jgi:hypothetical protein